MEHIERHDNGKMRMKAQLVDGELEGECVTYDEEERVISRSHYAKGKLDGETIRYGEGGRELEADGEDLVGAQVHGDAAGVRACQLHLHEEVLPDPRHGGNRKGPFHTAHMEDDGQIGRGLGGTHSQHGHPSEAKQPQVAVLRSWTAAAPG